jgi:hypothetical protein
MPTSKVIIIGCRASTPAREAIAPVRKGNIAQPMDPKLAVNPSAELVGCEGNSILMLVCFDAPIAPRWSSCGRTVVMTYSPTG